MSKTTRICLNQISFCFPCFRLKKYSKTKHTFPKLRCIVLMRCIVHHNRRHKVPCSSYVTKLLLFWQELRLGGHFVMSIQSAEISLCGCIGQPSNKRYKMKMLAKFWNQTQIHGHNIVQICP